MLTHTELDPNFGISEQLADTSDQPTILINIFDVDPTVRGQFRDAWLIDANFFKRQPGCISAQLHQGLEDSRIFVNYAVWENTAALAATNRQPEFAALRGVYPDGVIAHPNLFRRVHVPGICVGEYDGSVDLSACEQRSGLACVEPDACSTREQKDAGTSGRTTILIDLYDVDPHDHEYFLATWRRGAEFLKGQPGYVAAQLHKGVGASRLFLGYAVFEDAASCAATYARPELGSLRTMYPDSASARSYLLHRVAIPSICIGDEGGP